MTESQVREAMLRQFGMRIQPEMGQYVARRVRGRRRHNSLHGRYGRTNDL